VQCYLEETPLQNSSVTQLKEVGEGSSESAAYTAARDRARVEFAKMIRSKIQSGQTGQKVTAGPADSAAIIAKIFTDVQLTEIAFVREARCPDDSLRTWKVWVLAEMPTARFRSLVDKYQGK
jgi:hypothetical protein